MTCMSDVRGLASAKHALEVAATGGHNVLLIGPPGAGKTMLARRFMGLLPDIDETTLEEVRRIRQLVYQGTCRSEDGPAMRAPHYTVNLPGMRGTWPSGCLMPRPGEFSLAHGGVLYLDELPEFSEKHFDVVIDLTPSPDVAEDARLNESTVTIRERVSFFRGRLTPEDHSVAATIAAMTHHIDVEAWHLEEAAKLRAAWPRPTTPEISE